MFFLVVRDVFSLAREGYLNALSIVNVAMQGYFVKDLQISLTL
jgi:hypothetical protein